MIWFFVLVFVLSCFVLALSGHWLVSALGRIAKFLGWREFVVAFIIVSLGTSIPNLFVGISSALHKIPELSFGDVVGGNVVDLTLLIAISALIAKGIPVKSRMVQISSFFTFAIAVLPLLLILDGNLSRLDGSMLIAVFLIYIIWLFAKKERFTKIYDDGERQFSIGGLRYFFKDILLLMAGLVLLVLSSEIIVRSSVFFSKNLNTSIASIGLLIVALGNSLPETFFSIASAREGKNWMIVGNLMGSVIIPSTLVLGLVAIIHPIQMIAISPFAVARFFLIISSLFFIIFLRTGRKITQKEAIFLLMLYVSFVIVEILTANN